MIMVGRYIYIEGEPMENLENFIILFVWIILGALVLYVYKTGHSGRLEYATDLIRKSWYLIFLFGATIALTVDVTTLFTE